MSLKLLPAALRPREKLLHQGPAALADAELLALLLRTGSRGQGVLDLADTLLRTHGGLAGLLHRVQGPPDRPHPPSEAIAGLGPARQAGLAAALELVRRALAQQLREAPVFDAPQKVKDYTALHLAGLPCEVFAVLYLDTQHRLIALHELFRGSLAQTSVYPREVVRQALRLNAGAAILAHNHPSGVAEPSRADEALTQSLKTALGIVDVRLLDHLVVGQGQVVSFAERGLM